MSNTPLRRSTRTTTRVDYNERALQGKSTSRRSVPKSTLQPISETKPEMAGNNNIPNINFPDLPEDDEAINCAYLKATIQQGFAVEREHLTELYIQQQQFNNQVATSSQAAQNSRLAAQEAAISAANAANFVRNVDPRLTSSETNLAELRQSINNINTWATEHAAEFAELKTSTQYSVLQLTERADNTDETLRQNIIETKRNTRNHEVLTTEFFRLKDKYDAVPPHQQFTAIQGNLQPPRIDFGIMKNAGITYTEENRWHPHEFIEAFEDHMAMYKIENQHKAAAFKSVVITKDAAQWRQTCRSTDTYEATKTSFLKYYWNATIQGQAELQCDRVNSAKTLPELVAFLTRWLKTLAQSNHRGTEFLLQMFRTKMPKQFHRELPITNNTTVTEFIEKMQSIADDYQRLWHQEIKLEPFERGPNGNPRRTNIPRDTILNNRWNADMKPPKDQPSGNFAHHDMQGRAINGIPLNPFTMGYKQIGNGYNIPPPNRGPLALTAPPTPGVLAITNGKAPNFPPPNFQNNKHRAKPLEVKYLAYDAEGNCLGEFSPHSGQIEVPYNNTHSVNVTDIDTETDNTVPAYVIAYDQYGNVVDLEEEEQQQQPTATLPQETFFTATQVQQMLQMQQAQQSQAAMATLAANVAGIQFNTPPPPTTPQPTTQASQQAPITSPFTQTGPIPQPTAPNTTASTTTGTPQPNTTNTAQGNAKN
ncbi:unnamed protein product [Allacma fusca]|uniref:Uncharacterized protein n=1 Tax=Allacma fusca TaxID=39272 RepID=A0A8J2KJT1_9HEXA|nr:unnamed protein product [Allacma fusca]